MMLRVDEIVTGTRLRGLDPKAVGVLKESIKVIGLKVPISVRYLSDEEGYALVAGAHRLQACIELGMQEIPVQEEEGSELDARLWVPPLPHHPARVTYHSVTASDATTRAAEATSTASTSPVPRSRPSERRPCRFP
jgi:hypothetical protein